jgi:hypothetical protein
MAKRPSDEEEDPLDDIFGTPRSERRYTGLASVGKNKWLWCVWGKGIYPDADPEFYGHESTKEAGRTKILEVAHATGFAGNFLNGASNLVEEPRAHLALQWRSILAARQRRPNTKAAPDVQVTEYVYHADAPSDFGLSFGYHQHRILKKTAQWIVVERSCSGRIDNLGGAPRVPTFRLDRANMEDGECVRGEDWMGATGFYLSPPTEHEETPECLAALGLKGSPTETQVKSAFRRLSKKHHPDVGGDAEVFRKLCEHYEAALALVEKSNEPEN